MDFRLRGSSVEPPPAWLDHLAAAARQAGLAYEPVPLVGWMTGRGIMAAVRHLGGCLTLPPPHFPA